MSEYLTKKELLEELQRSKTTFCSFTNPAHMKYHAIAKEEEITPNFIQSIVDSLATPKGKRPGIIIAPEDVVIRVMTYDHIPLDPTRKRRPRNVDKPYTKTNFPPFKHYVLRDGALVEVARSHWKGDPSSGEFCLDHGRMTNGLASMFMLLVERIGRRPNWRSYSYLNDMQSHALLHLMENGLMFDESKSDNPFAFYTTVVNHAFTRILNLERKQQSMRDDLLSLEGVAPSFGRVMEHELRHMPVPPPIDRKRKPTRK